jgi:DNA invertase Pin-like site-specific DNA recombinase
MSEHHPTRQEPIDAVGYLRRSTDKQEPSLEDQRFWIEQWAEANGYNIIRWYVDDAISGHDTRKRAEFLRMVRDATEKGDFRAIICRDRKRFGRFDTHESGNCERQKFTFAASMVAKLTGTPLRGGLWIHSTKS